MGHNCRLPHNPFLCNRAIVGWYLSSSPVPSTPAGGSYVAAYLCQHEGDRYAVVTTTCGGSIGDGVEVLAVYLIGGGDTLTRLSRWPGAIESY